MISKTHGFWAIWITLALFIVWFFWVNGILQNMDLLKSFIITVVLLLPVYPIKRFVSSNPDWFYD